MSLSKTAKRIAQEWFKNKRRMPTPPCCCQIPKLPCQPTTVNKCSQCLPRLWGLLIGPLFWNWHWVALRIKVKIILTRHSRARCCIRREHNGHSHPYSADYTHGSMFLRKVLKGFDYFPINHPALIEIICNIINVFTVTPDQFNVSLLNNRFNLFL